MGTVSINGKTYVGNNISIINNQVFIDGVSQEKDLQGIVEVRIEGSIEDLSCDAACIVKGNVGSVEGGNSITVHGNIQGNASAGNSLTCAGSIGGNAKAGNSITAGSIAGKRSSGGSIPTW